MPIEPVKIPQNVYIEDRIIGPLTLKQIMLIALGGGFSYALYSSLLKAYGQLNIVVTSLVWTPLVVAAAFALIRINDLSLLKICFLTIERMNKPQVRAFSPRRGIEINIRLASSQAQAKGANKNNGTDAADEIHEKKIRELSSIVDQGVPLVADENVAPGTGVTEVTDGTDVKSQGNTSVTSDTPVLSAAEASDTPVTFPVNPSRVAVDGQKLDGTKGSDLSVFRDVFPSSASSA